MNTKTRSPDARSSRFGARRRWGVAVAAALVVGCGGLLKLAGYPPEARRTRPPAGIDTRVVAPRALAPVATLADTAGQSVRVGGAHDRETLLVFFRGHW